MFPFTSSLVSVALILYCDILLMPVGSVVSNSHYLFQGQTHIGANSLRRHTISALNC